MPEPFDAAFAAIPGTDPYPRESRYHGVGIAVHVQPDGTPVRYAMHRLLPPLPGPDDVRPHPVTEAERPDLLAQRYLGDPRQWWRIADANPGLDPRELTADPGRIIAVPVAPALRGTGAP
jgi:hypothetical protein